jgi:hypothetical protein
MVEDLGHNGYLKNHDYLGFLRYGQEGYMFTIVSTVSFITFGEMIALANMVTMFILAEKTCGTQPPGWRRAHLLVRSGCEVRLG